jgi:hypothetical protein
MAEEEDLWVYLEGLILCANTLASSCKLVLHLKWIIFRNTESLHTLNNSAQHIEQGFSTCCSPLCFVQPAYIFYMPTLSIFMMKNISLISENM